MLGEKWIFWQRGGVKSVDENARAFEVKAFQCLRRFPQKATRTRAREHGSRETWHKYRDMQQVQNTCRLGYRIGQSAVPSYFWSSIKWQISKLRRRVAISQLTSYASITILTSCIRSNPSIRIVLRLKSFSDETRICSNFFSIRECNVHLLFAVHLGKICVWTIIYSYNYLAMVSEMHLCNKLIFFPNCYLWILLTF